MGTIKTSLSEKVGYGFGDMSSSMFWKIFSYYLPFFYSNIFGLRLDQVGVLLVVTRIWDAVSDPMMGVIADRTRTKWGKYRPWVVGTAVPFALVFALSYLSPDWGVRAKTAWAAGTYALLMALYSFNNTPYSSLGGVMTDDGRERTSVATVRFVAATVATIVVQVATLPMVKMFEDPRTGWSVTVGIYAVFAAVMLVVSGCVAKERIAPPATQRKSLGEDMKSVLGDAPWRAMFVLTLFLFVTLALWGSASAYYFKYAVSEETLGFPFFNGVGQGITFVAVVTLPGILSDRFGKKTTYLVCLALTAVFTAGFYFVPATSRYGLLAMGALKSLAYAPTIPLLWAMMGDVADHGEWVSGRRATGFVFAGIVFALKAGLGLGGAVCGWILGAAGFDPEAASQTAAAQQAIRLSVSLIPAALFAVGCVALVFYPISKRTEREMQLELNARRSK